MRAYAGILLVAIVVGTAACTKREACENTEEKVRIRLNEMAEYSYNNGCLKAYLRLCDGHPGQRGAALARSKCQEQGIVDCEAGAKAFRTWLVGQKKT